MMGAAKSAPAMALSAMPRTVSIWRRFTFLAPVSADAPVLDSSIGFGSDICPLSAHGLGFMVARVGLARGFGALRAQPGHHVSHVSWRHWASRHAIAPVGVGKLRASGDDGRAQTLVANQREIRAINY